MASDWEKTDYEYPPSDDLDPSLEFEKPVQCYPKEAAFPVYLTNGIFDLPTTPFQALAINLTGRTQGRLNISTIEGTGAPKVIVHFHKSKETLPANLSHGLIDGVYGINITGPSLDDTTEKDECFVVAIKMEIPKGSLKFLEEFRIDADLHLSVSFEVDADEVGKKVKFNIFFGNIYMSGVDNAKDINATIVHGSIGAKNIVSENVSLNSTSGSVYLTSTNSSKSIDVSTIAGAISAKDITSDSIKLENTAGLISLENATASKSISVLSQYSSIHASNLTGGFKILTLESMSGSIHSNKVYLNKEEGTTVQVNAQSGSEISLNDFYGKFNITTGFGSVRVRGSDLEFGSNTQKKVDGTRGGDSGKSSLDMNVLFGSTLAEFL
ncbi:hypothetical protein HDU97_004156 [Phlyctochytrium planicorne]|nr:hypothetical protein HDU97_004156 [Phlyctochytrium planicorne]